MTTSKSKTASEVLNQLMSKYSEEERQILADIDFSNQHPKTLYDVAMGLDPKLADMLCEHDDHSVINQVRSRLLTAKAEIESALRTLEMEVEYKNLYTTVKNLNDNLTAALIEADNNLNIPPF